MSKSASDIEREINEAVRRAGLSAAGLWCIMRHLIEYECDGRPGEFRYGHAPTDAEQIALLARCSAAKVPGLLDKLSRPDVALLKRSADGTYHAPLLARLAEVRSLGARRVARHREKHEALRNAPRALRNTHVTPLVTPPSPPAPSPSFSPTPPLLSSPPPPPPVLGAVGGESAGGSGRTGSKGGKPPEPDLPLLLAVHPGFVAAWADWRAHLRAKRVRVTPAAAERQLELCLDWGPERAVAAIRHSIAGSYQGLFEPGGAGKANGVNGHAGPINREAREEAAHRQARAELEAEMRGVE